MSSDGPVTRQKEKKETTAGDSGVPGNMLQELKSLNNKMDGMKDVFEKQLNSKMDSLRNSMEKLAIENRDYLKAELALKTKEIQDNLDMELGHVVARIEQLEAKLDGAKHKASLRFDPDVSVIISGVQFVEGENVMAVVKDLLTEGLQWDSPRGVVAVERLRERGGRPGLIKVEFGSVQDKVDVLRKKQRLKIDDKFRRIYIRSAKSHTERLVELNFRTLLDEIPTRRQFYITGNGRVRKRPAATGADGNGHVNN